MLIPNGMTESQVLKIMETTIKQLMSSIRPFGLYKGADIVQQCYLFAIEALETGRYDPTRPLGGFLRTCIINRFISLSRDKLTRTEIPCTRCPFFDAEKKVNQSGCKVFEDKQSCDKFKSYWNRNKAKRNLFCMKVSPLFEETLTRDHTVFTDIDNKDLINDMISKLTPENKETARDILEGKKVKKNKLEKLREQIAEEYGVKDDSREE